MDASAIFTLQAKRIRKDLAGEMRWLGDTSWRNGAYAPFAGKLRSDIQKTVTELDALIADSQNGAGLRQRGLSTIRDRAGNLFSEALTLRLVGFIRESDIDAGMCALGDRLLAELARAVTLEVQHLSTLAEAEYFGASTRVIRLRYPSTSICDLPVLGHEFGHWFGPLWHAEGALQPYPQRAFLDSKVFANRKIAEEFFCDLLAVFLLGPAYVYMCLVLRFDPTNTFDPTRAGEDATHPGDAERAAWLLRALELLAQAPGDADTSSEYRRMAEQLRDFWNDYRTKSRAPEPAAVEVLNSEAENLFWKLQLAMPTAAYTNPSAAWGLAARYEQRSTVTLQQIELRDLLNACWFLRRNDLANLEKADRIDSWARGLV